MGNRGAREYTKRQQDEAAWVHAFTQPRSSLADLHAPRIGLRRLQLIVCPSFDVERAWEVRQLEDEWSLFRCEVVSDWPDLELLGYDRLTITSETLESFFKRIVSLSLPVAPHLDGMGGLDGEIYQLGVFGEMHSELRFQWWSDSPPNWKPLVEIAAEMIEAFSNANP